MIAQETFIVGGKEYTCFKMNAFTANKILMRLQKVAVPVIGSFMSSGKGLGEIDVQDAAKVIAENLNEDIMDSIILPMMQESKVYSVENKKFLKSGSDIDQCFTIDTLFDFYELAFLVGRANFSPFFSSLLSRFGSHLGAEAK